MSCHQEGNAPSFLKDTIVGEKESSVREVFGYFKSRVREIKGLEPELIGGEDGKLAKKRLEK